MRHGIDWGEVGSGERFERIVSTLLSTLHPASIRIDGSGGDGGRDHQLVSGDRLEVWQSKYFVGRLSDAGGRKNQIVRSLVKAAELQPDCWYLVTPMDPTPEELAWFNSVGVDYPFPVLWRGGSWLNANLADHPSIEYYFMDSSNRYVELVRELNKEQDALIDGLESGRERLESLAGKINESNPFYCVDITLTGGVVESVSLRPKYVGAEKDSPIEVNFAAAIDGRQDPELLERFASAVNWGDEVTIPAVNIKIDAPHGLGGSFAAGEVTLGPADSQQINLRVRMLAISAEGRQLAALPIILTSRTRGVLGVTASGQDRIGIVTVVMRVNLVQSTLAVNFSFRYVPDLLPGAMLPVLRFLQHAVAPQVLTLSIDGEIFAKDIKFPEMTPFGDEIIKVIEALDAIQRAAGDAFPVPNEWTLRDIQEVYRTARLVEGERVRVGEGPLFLTSQNPEQTARDFSDPPRFSFALAPKRDYVVSVAGHEINLGAYTVYVQAARLDPNDPIVEQDGERVVKIVPDSGYGIEVALGKLTIPPHGEAVE